MSDRCKGCGGLLPRGKMWHCCLVALCKWCFNKPKRPLSSFCSETCEDKHENYFLGPTGEAIVCVH